MALVIGLGVVNLINPGQTVPDSVRERLQEAYRSDVEARDSVATGARDRGPLQALVDIVPENIFGAAADNRNMLSIVFVAFLIGTALMLIPKSKARPLLEFFESIDTVIVKIVELILVFAPIGVFALIADTITSVAGDNPSDVMNLLAALSLYCFTTVIGMIIHILVTYTFLLKAFTPMSLSCFFSRIVPAQLVAFSTSSSAATLPVTMRTAERSLGVSNEVASFVLPLGATINMDGTALYQAVAAVFIAQTLGIDLDIAAQSTIVFMAMLASIGTAAVPSAGIVMLVIILEAVGIPIAGIALILGVDRILDMCRTTANVTGDTTVALVIASSENQLSPTAVNGIDSISNDMVENVDPMS